jgi:hypothetical protein
MIGSGTPRNGVVPADRPADRASPRAKTHRMAKSPCTPRELVDRLDARHDELIARLDELNAQIEAALAEFSRSRESPPIEVERRAAA